MAATAISNPLSNSSRLSSRRKKNKKIQISTHQTQTSNTNQWKSEAQQQVYSSKLLQALRQVRTSNSPSSSSRAVREAADRVLAVTAKGKTRWSRAILTNRLKMKFLKHKRKRVITGNGNSRSPKKPRMSVLACRTKNLPAVQRKTRVLGKLVPGCKKESLPVILEEATDYIAALKMQVKAMAALAELLSGGSSSFSGNVFGSSSAGVSRPSPP